MEYLWKLKNAGAIIFLKNSGKSKTDKNQRISEKRGRACTNYEGMSVLQK